MTVDAANLAQVLAYHNRTKHSSQRSAASLGFLDWATRPDPFRRFAGTRQVVLEEVPVTAEPAFDALFAGSALPARPVDFSSISQFFYDSLALSAWKDNGQKRWALRVNPSSGNLHPTEGYLLAPAISGVSDSPFIAHYNPHQHALEVRRELTVETWQALTEGLPTGSLLIGLSAIYWREAWKYGERAYRYCQHDCGHALAALSLSARTLGWQAQLLEGVVDTDLARLLGIDGQSGPEAEHPDALLALLPVPASGGRFAKPPELELKLNSDLARGAHAPRSPRDWEAAQTAIDTIANLPLQGTPNVLSPQHHPWPVVEEVGLAAQKRAVPDASDFAPELPATAASLVRPARAVSARQIIRQRRSAVSMDGQTGMPRSDFFHLLSRLLPRQENPAFALWPYAPQVSVALFVNRVHDLPRGLYLLARAPEHQPALKAACRASFVWEPVAAASADLPLYLLHAGDVGRTANLISCEQDIAEQGAFAVAMLARFSSTLQSRGTHWYGRLHWEAGLIGQVLYLEAEAAGLRGTGMGCFYDDETHQVLGFADQSWQTLYHFTMGGPVLDPRLQTLPPYQHRTAAGA